MNSKSSRILVVDGSEVSRVILSRILRIELPQAQVTSCGTAAQALEHLDAQHFDLVSTSLLLPDIDGLELSRRIRKNASHHYTPIIVVSGDADHRLLREGFAAGVTDYFDKSLGYQALAEFIKAFMRRNSGLVGSVLFVEDSPTAAALVSRIMERHGLQVTHTVSAEQALEFLLQSTQDNGTQFDIVVTDFFLKGALTGGDLLHAIRAKLHYSQQEMPVLVITHNDNEAIETEVFHAGANDFVSKPIVEEILMARVRSLLLIKQQFNALRTQAEEMQRIASTDSLTGVRSKRFLLDNGEQFIADPANKPVAALLLDIDHFKLINDRLGHITGDHVLAALGELLNECIPDDAMVVRFGGEEFAVILPRCTLPQAGRCAEELRAKVAQLTPVNIPITISIGVANSEDPPAQTLTTLLRQADKALYLAKEQGRNRVCLAVA